MIEVIYTISIQHPVDVVLSQYFDLEHLEHVHSGSFGVARLISEGSGDLLWDLHWPRLLGFLGLRSRIHQRLIAPNKVTAEIIGGIGRGTRSMFTVEHTPKGSLVVEEYYLACPNLPFLGSLIRRAWLRRVQRIWQEDLEVGLCHGGWPGLPKGIVRG